MNQCHHTTQLRLPLPHNQPHDLTLPCLALENVIVRNNFGSVSHWLGIHDFILYCSLCFNCSYTMYLFRFVNPQLKKCISLRLVAALLAALRLDNLKATESVSACLAGCLALHDLSSSHGRARPGRGPVKARDACTKVTHAA